ncbi:MAG: hypothetical protein ABIS84_05130 [Arachnia sp.]
MSVIADHGVMVATWGAMEPYESVHEGQVGRVASGVLSEARPPLLSKKEVVPRGCGNRVHVLLLNMDMALRSAAERLKAAVVAQRRGAADELEALVELVVDYDIVIDEDLIEELVMSTVPGGGEGTPEVHELVHLELCGLLGVTAWQARVRIFEALNLFYRHRVLWAAVQDLQLDVRRGCVAAMKCAGLSRADADLVGRQWFHEQAGLGWRAAMGLLDRLVIEADPVRAAKKDAEAAACREVVLWGHRENGCIDVTARMDALDALHLDATVDQIADILMSDPLNKGWSKRVLRAKALGIMATPALALALQQQAHRPEMQSELFGDDAWTPLDAESGRLDRDPHHCLGHVCGRVSVPPAKLQPRARVYLHIDDAALSGVGGAVLVEKVGWMSSLSLKALLGGNKVSIQPVIDLNTLPAEHQYRPSGRMREAVQLLHPVEAFPYSSTPSRGLDLDHTEPFRASCRDAQTGIGLLAPLGRKVHRARTVAAWHAQHRVAGEIVWTSPLGFRYLVTPERTTALE